MRYSKSLTPQIDSDGFGFYNGKRNTFRLGLGLNFTKAGAGIIGSHITLPLGINYIADKKRSGFETSIGITSAYNFNPGSNTNYSFGPIGYSPKLAAMGLLTMGYCLQSTNGFMLQANMSPVYYNKELSFFLAGLSIGYNLK